MTVHSSRSVNNMTITLLSQCEFATLPGRDKQASSKAAWRSAGTCDPTCTSSKLLVCMATLREQWIVGKRIEVLYGVDVARGVDQPSSSRLAGGRCSC